MITKFRALDSPDIQAPDTYLKVILPNSTNFLQAAEVKYLDLLGPIWTPNLERPDKVSKKMKLCHFFWILSRFVRSMITRISAPDVAGIETSRIYSEHIHLISRKLSTGRWSKNFFKKIERSCNSTLEFSIIFQSIITKNVLCFQRPVKKIVEFGSTRLRYLSCAWISGLSNALNFVIIRRTVTKTFAIYRPYE